MSNTVLGNKQEYTFYQETHEIELDDDEWIEMEGEIVDEQVIVGFRETCPKASQYHHYSGRWTSCGFDDK